MARPKKLTKEQFFQVVQRNIKNNDPLLCRDFSDYLGDGEEECDYCPFLKLCSSTNHKNYSDANKMILDLLNIENNKRLSIWQTIK